MTMAMVLMAADLQAQEPLDPKFAQLDIHSSVVCDQCKHILEEELIYEKGVQSVNVDVDAKVIHIQYRAKKNDPDKLRQAVAKVGYDADSVKADPKAQSELPFCCRPGGNRDH